MAMSRCVFFPHSPFLAVSRETHHYKGFLPEIFHGRPTIRKAAHVYRKSSYPPWQTLCSVVSQLCDNKMAISDLQGAVGNQIKYVIRDIITSIVFNRALCQLLRQSFNKVYRILKLVTITSLRDAVRNLANLVGRGSI
uniref:NPD001 n=1 Tax=Homo sapiens TaxID=9606 RepID=Q9Y6G6_HUMAN|nr:NPD001 [Homo sapiens]